MSRQRRLNRPPRPSRSMCRSCVWWTIASVQLLALLALIVGAASPALHSELFHGEWKTASATGTSADAQLGHTCEEPAASDNGGCSGADSTPSPANAGAAHNCLLCALPQGIAVGGFPAVSLSPPAHALFEIAFLSASPEAVPTFVVDPGCPPRGPPLV
jgi:hypothetical protein